MTESNFKRSVSDRARRMRASRSRGRRFWTGLGLVGALGWVVVIPMVGGLFLGRWLDEKLESKLTFTLALLSAGLVVGVYTAWRFFLREEM